MRQLPHPLPTSLDRRGREIGALLVAAGALTPDQLDAALVEQAKSGRRLGELLVEHGWATSTAVAEALAEQAGIQFLDLKRAELDRAATGLLPEKFARRYGALPIRFVDDQTVLVAVVDPTDVVTRDDLRIALGLEVQLGVAERRAPQDGRITIRYGKQPMDLRIAVLPTTYGEQIVLRILHRSEGHLGLDSLGMSPAAAEVFMRSLNQPYGAVIAVGPTGSGKTTTLYAGLDLLNDEGRVLTTIEDPVEWQIPGVNQVEVNNRAGLTFARGLRTLLRADPDVVLVGEIRDEETARIAIQAAMTGHLVLTSLHTHNAAASIARLKDMGVEPALVATAINCIVAQRLARKLCQECREPYQPDAAECAELGLEPGVTLYRAVGCGRCNGTGYRGRVALYEVMPIHGRIRRLVEASTEEIFAAAVEEGMTTLRSDGIRLCLAGTSSIDEIRRVTGDRLV